MPPDASRHQRAARQDGSKPERPLWRKSLIFLVPALIVLLFLILILNIAALA